MHSDKTDDQADPARLCISLQPFDPRQLGLAEDPPGSTVNGRTIRRRLDRDFEASIALPSIRLRNLPALRSRGSRR